MRKQLTDEDFSVTNSEGKQVRFDLELRENEFGCQFATAIQRADTEAPLMSAREEIVGKLAKIDGIRLSDLTYCERDQRLGVETMNFKEAPHLGPDRLERTSRVQFLSEDNYRWMIENARPGVAHAEQQREQMQQMRETALPKLEQ